MLDTYGIISMRHQGTARHFDDADNLSYTLQARFGGCALVSQPVQHVEAGFCVSGERTMKQCKICGETKPYSEFDRHGSTKDRRDSRCKACQKKRREMNKEQIRERNQAYYTANADQLRKYRRQYCEANPDIVREYREKHQEYYRTKNREYRETHEEERKLYTRKQYQLKRHERIAYSKQYRLENPEKIRSSLRDYRQRNKEKIRISGKLYRYQHIQKYRRLWADYRQRHAEQVKIRSHRIRAHRAAAPGTFTVQEWRELRDRYNNQCLCCGTVEKLLTPDHVIPLSRGGSNDISNIQPLCLDRKSVV